MAAGREEDDGDDEESWALGSKPTDEDPEPLPRISLSPLSSLLLLIPPLHHARVTGLI